MHAFYKRCAGILIGMIVAVLVRVAESEGFEGTDLASLAHLETLILARSVLSREKSRYQCLTQTRNRLTSVDLFVHQQGILSKLLYPVSAQIKNESKILSFFLFATARFPELSACGK